MTLRELIEELQRIQEAAEDHDPDVWIRIGRREELAGKIRYEPDTETKYGGVIIS